MAIAGTPPLLVWTDSLSVNVRHIDSQHKRLISLTNRLQEAVMYGQGRHPQFSILSELVECLKAHFAAEECMLRETHYLDFREHKLEHDSFTDQMLHLQREFAAGRMMLSFEIMQFLKLWLQQHILGADKKYAPHVHAQGIR